jgi:hypothetical protein
MGQESLFANQSEISICHFNTQSLATVKGMPALKTEIERNRGHPPTRSTIPTSDENIAACK